MRAPEDVVRALLVTEKGTQEAPQGKFLFHVDINANKIEIRKAVEQLYKVKVKKVNTQVMRGKIKRVRYRAGRTADWKKAIVTLRPGFKIEVA